MNIYISIFLSFVTLFGITACSSDILDEALTNDGNRHTCRMSLNGNISGYSDEATSRATTTSVPTDVTLYLYFNANGTTVPAAATYDTSNKIWNVSYEGTLSANSTCKVYYITNAKSATETEVQLSSSSAIYGTESGKYTYSDDNGVSVTASLKPVLSRVRFNGISGTAISINGAKTANVFNVPAGTYTTSTSFQTITVASDGYTPYLYYVGPDEADLDIKYDDDEFYISNPLKSGGNSGYIVIPTKSSHNGWSMAGEPEAVDLGLSVKWATFNVGARSPEDYGDYYAWGETETKSNYDWSTYKWCNGSGTTMTKYCTSSSYGTVDNKTTLELEDDVAHVKWGGNWRMPTYKELCELYNCTMTWATINGVSGCKVTAKNGNSIFLPVRYSSSINYYGSLYMSSSLCISTWGQTEGSADDCEYLLRLENWGTYPSYQTTYYERCGGYPVRPVCK